MALAMAFQPPGTFTGVLGVLACGRRNAMPGELLVRITPNHVVAQADIATRSVRRGW